MPDALETVKQTINEILRQLGEALRARSRHVADMNRAIEKAKDEHQPLIDALDVSIDSLMQQIRTNVGFHFNALFPPARKNNMLKLPLGVIKIGTSDYKHDIVDDAGVQELVKAQGGDEALDIVAPAVRATRLTPLKDKYSALLDAAIAKGLITRSGGDQFVTAIPSDADTKAKGGPSLSRPI